MPAPSGEPACIVGARRVTAGARRYPLLECAALEHSRLLCCAPRACSTGCPHERASCPAGAARSLTGFDQRGRPLPRSGWAALSWRWVPCAPFLPGTNITMRLLPGESCDAHLSCGCRRLLRGADEAGRAVCSERAAASHLPLPSPRWEPLVAAAGVRRLCRAHRGGPRQRPGLAARRSAGVQVGGWAGGGGRGTAPGAGLACHLGGAAPPKSLLPPRAIAVLRPCAFALSGGSGAMLAGG